MPVYEWNGMRPALPAGALWIAPDAHLIGDCVLGDGVGVWFGAVVRADNARITVGARSNLQEHVMIHVDPGFPVTIGEGCTIGHRAIIHGCTIGDNSLVGMGAIVLNGAKVGKNCLIGAGALITEGKEIPDGSLVMGAPGKVVRQLDDKAIAGLRLSADHYAEKAASFASQLRVLDTNAVKRDAA